MEEKELVIAFKNGEEAAFEALFSLYEDKALRTAFLLCQNREMARDIVQDSFVHCCLNIGKLRSAEAFRPWFYRILTRTAFALMKKEKKYLPVEEFFERDTESFADEPFERYAEKERAEFLRREILRLSDKQRTVIVLHYFNGLSVEEIAAATGSFQGTVKSRLFFAREKLRAELSKQNHKLQGDEIHES